MCVCVCACVRACECVHCVCECTSGCAIYIDVCDMYNEWFDGPHINICTHNSTCHNIPRLQYRGAFREPAV